MGISACAIYPSVHQISHFNNMHAIAFDYIENMQIIIKVFYFCIKTKYSASVNF